uniref:Ig-like domain-containing protein n=1 Tax=Paramormyrops kingsleyae TaxID=1676925 RepID=A0A3B3RSJ6_9TELE
MNTCNGVPVAVKAGQKATLTCPLRTASRMHISWYRQSRGFGPQFVLSYLVHNATNLFYGRGLNSSHFAVRGGENGTALQQLEITTATRNDTAIYYCGSPPRTPPLTHGTFYNLHVLLHSQFSPPTVVVLQPLLPDQRSSGPVVLVCLVRGLPDSQVRLHWTVNEEKINDGDATSEASVDTDGSYSATGFLLIPVTHWHPNNIYRCIVNHGSHVYEGSRQASSYTCILRIFLSCNLTYLSNLSNLLQCLVTFTVLNSNVIKKNGTIEYSIWKPGFSFTPLCTIV